MKFAAELYASRHKAKFTQMFLTAVEVSGNPPAVQKFNLSFSLDVLV